MFSTVSVDSVLSLCSMRVRFCFDSSIFDRAFSLRVLVLVWNFSSERKKRISLGILSQRIIETSLIFSSSLRNSDDISSNPSVIILSAIGMASFAALDTDSVIFSAELETVVYVADALFDIDDDTFVAGYYAVSSQQEIKPK